MVIKIFGDIYVELYVGQSKGIYNPMVCIFVSAFLWNGLYFWGLYWLHTTITVVDIFKNNLGKY